MKREIKFRAWDINHKCFRNDEFLISTTNGGKIQVIGVSVDNESCNINEDVILMQYTGLIDKNGKEIYEGDVVTNGKAFFTITLGDCEWVCVGNNRRDKTLHELSWVINEKYEIIGNIYENKELLNHKN